MNWIITGGAGFIGCNVAASLLWNGHEVIVLDCGHRNVLSLLDPIQRIRDRYGAAISYSHYTWRPGDKKVFVSDIAKAERLLDWHPRIGKEEGVTKLFNWVRDNAVLFTGAA